MEKFWLEDPSALFQSLTLIPQCDMSIPERLNALTRLILVITLILFFLRLCWWLFLLLGIIMVIILYLIYYNQKPVTENYTCPKRQDEFIPYR